MSPSSKSANLERIRNNQRRSRARKKEYVQELEGRLRKVELQGVNAASEIQVAARRVASENKKLRALLHQNGVTEDAIETYLYTAATPPLDGSPTGRQAGFGHSVNSLEQLLVPRRPSCASLSVPLPSPQGRSSREPSVASDSACHSSGSWEPGPATSATRTSPISASVATSPLPRPTQQLGPMQIPSPRCQEVGGYGIGVSQPNNSFPPYGTDYDSAIPLPYLQLPSPPNQQYNNMTVDYFSPSRDFPQNQYPC
ncbi:hypothetical protein jhhlp_003861 [Lomentospora prolificans]|uniref:BZIP domain-containing protein n=1 Tax=Lomentospora prolificans TaxID=41688 RepID=A0A2N3NA12_9PEZI|nr:hypothetical protein jhhlp_003861 [Lomentospora prolificans]